MHQVDPQDNPSEAVVFGDRQNRESTHKHQVHRFAHFHLSEYGKMTVFDFDDCCLHLPMYDIATALWSLRNRNADERKQYMAWISGGYAYAFAALGDWRVTLQDLFDWRSIYLFSHYLYKWGSDLGEQKLRWLERMRQEIESPTQWTAPQK